MNVTGAELAGSLVPAYQSGGDWFPDFADNHDGAWLAIADPKATGPVAMRGFSVAVSALRGARRSDATLEQDVTMLTRSSAKSGAQISPSTR